VSARHFSRIKYIKWHDASLAQRRKAQRIENTIADERGLTLPTFRRTLASTMSAWFDATIAKLKELVAHFRGNKKRRFPL
jgi:predicted lipoprotein with Yx(FWY)xxD motif